MNKIDIKFNLIKIKMAQKRILVEIENIDKNFHICKTNDVLQQKILFTVEDECSPYYEKQITVVFKFPYNYPFNPPRISFLPSLFHPNVDSKGFLDISIFDWSPAININSFLINIVCLMSKPHICEEYLSLNDKEKEEDDREDACVNIYAWKLWNSDIETYKKIIETI
jgi:ubiquitin-protein ligase